jgi:uncharacterized protein YndB with AHSA1/START domain
VADIGLRVGITQPIDRVFETLTTIEGLRGFWTSGMAGDAGAGGSLQVYFGKPEPAATMEVAQVTEPGLVEWRCVQGPDEWVATRLTFEMREQDGETVVRFTHAGWPEGSEFMRHCGTKWAYFLVGMKQWLEGGPSVAFPNDLAISSWG